MIKLKIIFFLLLGSMLLFFVLSKDQKNKNNEKLLIVCTTSILADTVKQLAGNHCTIECLMGPRVDPHMYHAKESDVHKLASANLILYHGLHLEGKMAHVLEQMNCYTKAVAVCNQLPKNTLKSTEMPSIYDPHVWHDVQLWLLVVLHITQLLVETDPKNKHFYQENLARYHTQLVELDNYVRSRIAQLPRHQRVLITAHDAFSYFGSAYGLRVVGLQGISTDGEVGTRDIQELVNFIVEHHIKALFVESSISPRNIQAVQRAVHAQGWHITCGPELFSDALGPHNTTANTYYGMIKHNVDTIVQALR